MLNFLKLIESKGYITVSKELARNIGLDETMILTELISKYNYWKEQGQLTEDGYFYITIKDLKHETTLSKYRQTQAINNLKNMKLIKTKRQGLPAKRYFTISEKEIIKLFFKIDKKEEKNTDNPRNDQEVKNSKTSKGKSRKQEVKNSPQLRTNNNNKTEEEDARKIPEKISTKFEQVFNRKMSVELYNKLIKIYSDPQILLKALQVAEEQADKPKYLLVILKDWKKENMTSVSEINSYLEKRDKNNSKKSRRSSPSNKKEHDKLHNIEELKAKGWN